jgi:hypothetical protein
MYNISEIYKNTYKIQHCIVCLYLTHSQGNWPLCKQVQIRCVVLQLQVLLSPWMWMFMCVCVYVPMFLCSYTSVSVYVSVCLCFCVLVCLCVQSYHEAIEVISFRKVHNSFWQDLFPKTKILNPKCDFLFR